MLTPCLREVLLPRLEPDDILVMDNLGAHHAAAVDEVLRRANHRVIFLPPDSPELNPIEEAWSKPKTLVRSLAPQSLSELHDAIATALRAITAADARGWFNHCGYPVPDRV